jgi:hypothetical protein
MRPVTAPSGARRKETVIRVHIGEHSVDIAVTNDGKGQTTRWLALAASQRYLQAISENGAVRASDVVSPASGRPLVSSLSIVKTNQLVGPTMSIETLLQKMQDLGADAVQSGLRAVLSTTSTSTRKPSRHDQATRDLSLDAWSAVSFTRSSAGRPIAEVRLAEWQVEERKRAADAAAAAAAEQKAQREKLGRLLVTDTDSPEGLAASFEYDASNVRFHLLSQDADDQRRMRRDVYKYYPALCDLFRTFSGGLKGPVYSMEKNEMIHLLLAARAVDITKERKLVLKCFEKANSGRGDAADKTQDDRDPDSLSRFEFIEFLLLLADAKYGADLDPVRGERLGPAGAFLRFVNEKLADLVAKLNAGPVRAALREQSLQAFILPLLPDLMKVFEYYAALSPDEGTFGSARKVLVSLDEFIIILEHSGLLDDVSVLSGQAAQAAAAQLKNAKASLTAQEVRETFSGVQRDDDGSSLAGVEAQEELTFGEFLEAIGRIAIAKWGDVVGLKYVLDARQGLRAVGPLANGSSGGGDVFVRTERTIVRCLIMWAFGAAADLSKHLGRNTDGPVKYDCAELVRLIGIGLPDVQAAMASRGSAQAAAVLAAHAAATAAANSDVTAGIGMELGRASKPKAAFGFALPATKATFLAR